MLALLCNDEIAAQYRGSGSDFETSTIARGKNAVKLWITERRSVDGRVDNRPIKPENWAKSTLTLP